MLRTNTKKARQNIRNYIIENFCPEDYAEYYGTISEGASFAEVARYILNIFRAERWHSPQDFRYYHNSEAAAFADYCAGLPAILDTCYYYNRSAVDDLGEILEETSAERDRYTETQAEQLLTSLIYRELKEASR